MISPLLLKSAVLTDDWGSALLCDGFGVTFGEDDKPPIISELISFCGTGKPQSTVRSGEYAGLSLSKAVERMGRPALGERLKKADKFPFSIKIISPGKDLPLTVSKSARLFYIIDCVKDSKAALGFKREIKNNELVSAVKLRTAEQLCRFITVNKGDCITVPPKTVFSLHAGVTAVEISAANNVLTADDSDFLKTVSTAKAAEIKTDDETMLFPFGTVKTVSAKDEFVCELLSLDGNAGLFDGKSFSAFIVIDGEAIVSYPSGNISLSRGDCVFLPAGLRIIISGRADILNVHM